MKPRVDRCRAYTLIEIMLVVAIMLIIVSVGVPSLFKSLRKDALRGAVSDVLSTCAQARAQAILSGGPVEFVMTVFAVDDLRLSIQPGRRRDAGGEGEESLPPLTMLDADEELGNSDAPGSVRIHEDIAVQNIFVNLREVDMNASQVRVRFYPNGMSDEFSMLLNWVVMNQLRIIKVDPMTGLAEVESVE